MSPTHMVINQPNESIESEIFWYDSSIIMTHIWIQARNLSLFTVHFSSFLCQVNITDLSFNIWPKMNSSKLVWWFIRITHQKTVLRMSDNRLDTFIKMGSPDNFLQTLKSKQTNIGFFIDAMRFYWLHNWSQRSGNPRPGSMHRSSE